MSLGSIQPLTEISTRNICWSKGGRRVELTILPPLCADFDEIREPRFPGALRAVRACNGIALILLRRTQHRFKIKLRLHMHAACFGHHQACQSENLIKEDVTR